MPTHLPVLRSMECEILAGFSGRFAVSGAGVRCGEGCARVHDRYSGDESGAVQRGLPQVADAAGKAVGTAAECGRGTGKSQHDGRRDTGWSNSVAHGSLQGAPVRMWRRFGTPVLKCSAVVSQPARGSGSIVLLDHYAVGEEAVQQPLSACSTVRAHLRPSMVAATQK